MKLGVNSFLFGGYDLETAFRWTATCGYDGIELGAVDGLADHLPLGEWRSRVGEVHRLAREYGLELLAIEPATPDGERMEQAFQAAVELGIPVVNCGSGGTSGDEQSLTLAIDNLCRLAERAEHYGVTLCVKAHVGAAIFDTPTTLQALQAIDSSRFGLDMDPSHIHRAGEDAVEALRAVVSRIRHVHIRDCRGSGPSPGTPEEQANGRGDIDLLGYVRVLYESGYDGPVDLEVIGAKKYELPRCIAVAAEAHGHLRACLQACGAR